MREDGPALAQYARGSSSAKNVELLTQAAGSELDVGRGKEALVHVRQAEALDPRSLSTIKTVAYTMIALRRHSEALAASDRALALAPDNLSVIHLCWHLILRLARLSSGGARSVRLAVVCTTVRHRTVPHFSPA